MSKFTFRFLGHAMAIISEENLNILVDPFFKGEFFYDDHIETLLTHPRERLEDLERIDCIFITHIHGDHYDPNSIKYLVDKYNGLVLAPAEVIEDALKKGIGQNNLKAIERNDRIKVGSLTVKCITGFDNSFDENGLNNKFSYLFDNGRKRLFYSGDCHHITDADENIEKVDYYAGWSADYAVASALEKLHPDNFIMLHYDDFVPGAFWCNKDCNIEKSRLCDFHKELNVIVPENENRIIEIDT